MAGLRRRRRWHGVGLHLSGQFLDALFGAVENLAAAADQGDAALVFRDGLLEADLAGLDAVNDGLNLFHGAFKVEGAVGGLPGGDRGSVVLAVVRSGGGHSDTLSAGSEQVHLVSRGLGPAGLARETRRGSGDLEPGGGFGAVALDR